MIYKAVFSQEYDEDVISKKKQNKICELLNCDFKDVYEVSFEYDVVAYTTDENFEYINANFDDINESFIPHVINDVDDDVEEIEYDDNVFFFFKRKWT